MSLRKRLLNVARAELRAAADRLSGRAGHPDTDLVDKELAEEEAPPPEAEAPKGSPRTVRREQQIQVWYANLELPLGATSAEVKAAYRRLMRRYHPDLHQQDAEAAATATKLAQELRTAYEGLLAHLERT